MSQQITLTYNEVFATVDVPEGIDLKSKDVRWYVKYNTLYIETRDGKKYEIDAEMNDDFHSPDELTIEDPDGEVYTPSCWENGEHWDTFSARDRKYKEPQPTGAYDDQYSLDSESESEEESPPPVKKPDELEALNKMIDDTLKQIEEAKKHEFESHTVDVMELYVEKLKSRRKTIQLSLTRGYERVLAF